MTPAPAAGKGKGRRVFAVGKRTGKLGRLVARARVAARRFDRAPSFSREVALLAALHDLARFFHSVGSSGVRSWE